MNRPIKFRAKGRSDGQWHYGGAYRYDGKTEEWCYIVEPGFSQNQLMDVLTPVIPSTLGQFTGLYDKNGKEIYEGDILQSDKPNASLCVVFWSTEKTAFIYRFYWKRIDDTQEIGKKSRYTIGDWNMIEKNLAVIGNIHNNPELMKGGD